MSAGRRSVRVSPPERHPFGGRKGWKAVWTFRSSLSPSDRRIVFDFGIASTWSSLLLSDFTHGWLSALQKFRKTSSKMTQTYTNLRKSFLDELISPKCRNLVIKSNVPRSHSGLQGGDHIQLLVPSAVTRRIPEQDPAPRRTCRLPHNVMLIPNSAVLL